MMIEALKTPFCQTDVLCSAGIGNLKAVVKQSEFLYNNKKFPMDKIEINFKEVYKSK
jgi:hypothetical protein